MINNHEQIYLLRMHKPRVLLAIAFEGQAHTFQSLLALHRPTGSNALLCDTHQTRCNHRNWCQTNPPTASIVYYIWRLHFSFH